MSYLIMQMLLCLLLAFALGLLLGWLLWGRREDRVIVDEECSRNLAAARKEIEDLRARLAACEKEREGLLAKLAAATDKAAGLGAQVGVMGAELADVHRRDDMKGLFYDIETIEGIAQVYGDKLRSIGIPTTKELLLRCGDPAGRAAVGSELDFREELLLKWACIADLMRVSGIGEEFSELVEESGVRSMPELADCDPEALIAEMTRVDEAKNLTRRIPTHEQVESWKGQAPDLGSVIDFG